MTYRVQRSCGHGWEGKADHLPVPALNILTPLVPLAAVLCFPGGFHDTFPTNRFPTAHLQQTCNHTDCQSANIVQPYSSCRLFRHAVPSPSFPTWKLRYLNTLVRVCFAQPSHSGAECDPRHWGAVSLGKHSLNLPPLTGTSLELTYTPTESTATTAAGPYHGSP